MLLALGVISDPGGRLRRSWIRQSTSAFRCTNREPCLHSLIAQRFVIGTVSGSVGHARARCDALLPEAERHRDLFFVNAVDGPVEEGRWARLADAGCIDKSFAWYEAALSRFPQATYLAKTDDDSFNHLPNLEVRPGWLKEASEIAVAFSSCPHYLAGPTTAHAQ